MWYIGNFDPPHSTENHVARALRNNGDTVVLLQENAGAFESAISMLRHVGRPDFILWTRTRWGAEIHDANRPWAYMMLRYARLLGVPVVGYHLDIWWGLKRETEIEHEPFFESTLLVTADGGHDDEWRNAGVNHLWMPPAISLDEARLGTPRDEYRSLIAFVGSHDGGYHREHRHRHELVDWLRRNYRRDCAFWPQPGHGAVRGDALQDLYASVDVVVGDSCFAGTGLANYWSDRIPETIGRGGFLLHPDVPGLERHFSDGAHLRTWQAFDWDALHDGITWALDNSDKRRAIALKGREHVLEHHTYERRMSDLVAELRSRGMVES